MGIAQPLADIIKLATKEDFRPSTSISFLYALAPMISLRTAFAAFAILPFGNVANIFGQHVGLYGKRSSRSASVGRETNRGGHIDGRADAEAGSEGDDVKDVQEALIERGAGSTDRSIGAGKCAAVTARRRGGGEEEELV